MKIAQDQLELDKAAKKPAIEVVIENEVDDEL